MTKKLTNEDRRKRLYQRILNNDTFVIKDIASIVQKETSTIRTWEKNGIIPKAKKYAKNVDDEIHPRRKYSKKDLLDVLKGVIEYNWIRSTIDNKDEINKIIDYIECSLDIETTKRER